jgi:opacity protein-like surface antigen
MRFRKIVVVGLVMLPVGSALAGDMSDVPDAPIIDLADFRGAYAGVGATSQNSITAVEHIVTLDGVVGFNVQSEELLVGIEGYAAASFSDISGSAIALGVEGRAGVVVNEKAVVYGGAGLEAYNVLGTPSYFVTTGVGVEFRVSDNTSLDLEVKHYTPFTGVGWAGNAVSAQLLWQF